MRLFIIIVLALLVAWALVSVAGVFLTFLCLLF